MEENHLVTLKEILDFASHNFKYIVNWIINQFIFAFVFGAGIIAVIKGFFLFQSLRLYSLLMLSLNRKKFYRHSVFNVLEIKNFTNDQFNGIHDHGKRELIKFIFYVELKQTKMLLKRILKFTLKESLLKFLRSSVFGRDKLTKEHFLNHCQIEVLAFRNSISDYFRIRMRNDISSEDLNRFLSVYYEFTEVFHRQIITNLEIFRNRKNLYGIVWQLLDLYESVILCYLHTIEAKVNRANGRLSGIKIRGYIVK